MKPFTIIDCDQRTPEWLAVRCGLLTGSAAADVLAKGRTKNEEAAKRRDIRTRLVLERLTGVSQDDGYVNHDMRRGTELEPEALAAYESEAGVLITRVGFLKHNEQPIGFSPDGIIDDYAGFVEMKVPRSATHLRYLRAGAAPPEYQPQLWHGFLVTGAQYADFCSWDPRFPEPLRLFRVRVERSEFEVMAYQRAVTAFMKEVDEECELVKRLALNAVA